MSDALLGLSRYLLTLFVIFYTFHCFVVFIFKSEEERTPFYVIQNILMALTHILGFYVLAVRSSDPDLLFICAFQEVMFFAVIILYRMIYPGASRLITNNICFLLAVSFIILTRLSYDRSIRQFVVVAVSLVLTLIIPFVISKLEFLLKRYTMYYGVAGIIILLAMMTRGTVTNGSKITLTIGGMTFLPSEFVKVLFVFFIAGMLADEDNIDEETGLPHRNRIISAVLISALHILILAMCKDLGGAMIFFVVAVFTMYAALKKPLILAGGAVSGVLASIVGYKLFSHVRVRVAAWRDPFADIEGKGYQLSQSLFAIGTGSWAGMGLFMGSPEKIPVVEADFIFSAISEEMGCLFSLCLILICLSNFLMFMNISMSIGDGYFKVISLGLAVNYGFQIFLTIGGVTKLIPLTGVTLPLVSYGGTSVMSTLFMFAIIQGLYIMKRGTQG
ncbi:MAG: FtsW/RodA/SpoVE family cell cycle protein [Lachnospiraceae bacterium]|nr:FtsW/RodA/SpoVE family cell cycle protein [Lachnospiraceae bacterium]